MMPAPQIAIAWPTFSRGLMSSSTACDSGTSAAPNTPCSRRAATISTRLSARPHSAEATVKPTTEIEEHLRRPQWPRTASRSAACAIAAATM